MEGPDELERQLLESFKEEQNRELLCSEEAQKSEKSIDFTSFGQIGEIENLFTTIW